MDVPDSIPVEELLEHDAWLRLLAAHLVGAGPEADELVQETWLAALRRPPRRASGDPRGWLRRVLERARLQAGRASARREEHEVRAAEERARHAETTAGVEDALELRRVLLDELAALDEPLRVALGLRYLEGLGVAEVAARLGLPLDTAKGRLKRGLALLRERLDRREGDRRGWLALCAPYLRADALPRTPLTSTLTRFALMTAGTKFIVVTTAALVVLVLGLALRGDSERSPELEEAPVHAEVSTVEPEAPGPEPSAERDAAGRRTRVLTPGTTVGIPAEELDGVVRGHVLDPRGRPVGGAVVRAVDGDASAVSCDAAGAFGWPLEEEPVLLHADDATRTTLLRGHALAPPAAPLVLVVASRATYAGVVRDERGEPVVDAELLLELEPTWSRELDADLSGGALRRWHAKSDARGRFRLEGVPALGDALLWVRRDGRTALYRAPGETRLDLELELRLERPTADERWAGIPHLTGRVRDAVGEPVEGARLVAQGFDARSDAEGAFRLPYSALDATSPLRVLARGHAPLEVHAPGVDRDATHGWPAHLELRLTGAEVGTVAGVVVDGQGGPVAGARVFWRAATALDDGPEPELVEAIVGEVACETGPEGGFVLTALDGRAYALQAHDPSSGARGRLAPVYAGESGLRLVLDTPPGRGVVRGRCVDLDGTPLAGLEVWPVWRLGPRDPGVARGGVAAHTDAEGRFVLEDHPLGFDALRVEGPGIVEQQHEVAPRDRGPHHLVLRRRARVRVRTQLEPEARKLFVLRDAAGALLPLYRYQLIAGGTLEGADITYWGELEEGASPTYTAIEGDCTLELLVDGERVLRSVELRLVGGEVTWVLVE